MAKLFEGFHRSGVDFEVVLVDRGRVRGPSVPTSVRIEDLGARFHVLSMGPAEGSARTQTWGSWPLTALPLRVRATRVLASVLRGYGPDVVYVDRANAAIGAAMATWGRIPVFLRLHGVVSLYEQFRRWTFVCRRPLYFASFRAHFGRVLITKDGTPGEPFARRFLRTSVPWCTMLNGVDRAGLEAACRDEARAALGIPEDACIVLFVGRLEESKGCVPFVEAVSRVVRSRRNVRGVVAGGGPLADRLEGIAREAGVADGIQFAGEVEHSVVARYYAASDVYVSVNRHGNLSNTVLEALAAGSCVALPRFAPGDPRDADVPGLLGDACEFYPWEDRVAGMAATFERLAADGPGRRARAERARAWAVGNLLSWDERIRREIDLIESVVRSRVHRPREGRDSYVAPPGAQ